MILYVLHDLMGSSSWMEQPPTSKEPGQAVPLPQTLLSKNLPTAQHVAPLSSSHASGP